MKHISYYDIGLNLFSPSFPNPEKILEDAHAAGIQCILTGSDAEENEKVNTFVKTHDAYGTAGIHPHATDGAKDEDIDRIEEIVSENPRIVAVGECGLDYDHMYAKKENQLHYFPRLIRLAEKLKKPLFLHERDAADDFIRAFAGHEEICRRSVVHCYTGNREVLEKLLAMGFYIGITGWICDERRGDDLRDAVKILPLERVMIETDAPYLTPRGFHLPRTNVPQNITYVAEALAHYMGVSKEDLLRHAKENTEALFRLPKDE
jgi:TatD DNase family protein